VRKNLSLLAESPNMKNIDEETTGGINNAFSLMGNVAIVLVRPKYPENIGAAARIAANMGINRLILVGKEFPDQERMKKTATHHNTHLLDTMEFYADIKNAIAEFSWIVGTSAREGRQRRLISSPKKMIHDLLPKLSANKTALVFGPEDCGLTNDELKVCNAIVTIPTANFSSLNLAQAVAIISYELYTGILERNCDKATEKNSLKLAQSYELSGMYEQIEFALRRMNFLREHEYGYWMLNIRNFLGRIGLRAREVKFIRGFCRQLINFTNQ